MLFPIPETTCTMKYMSNVFDARNLLVGLMEHSDVFGNFVISVYGVLCIVYRDGV